MDVFSRIFGTIAAVTICIFLAICMGIGEALVWTVDNTYDLVMPGTPKADEKRAKAEQAERIVRGQGEQKAAVERRAMEAAEAAKPIEQRFEEKVLSSFRPFLDAFEEHKVVKEWSRRSRVEVQPTGGLPYTAMATYGTNNWYFQSHDGTNWEVVDVRNAVRTPLTDGAVEHRDIRMRIAVEATAAANRR